MAKLKLARCPFCGDEAEVARTYIYMDEARVIRCKGCYARTATVLVNHPKMIGGRLDESTRYTADQAEEKAAEFWNKRS